MQPLVGARRVAGGVDDEVRGEDGLAKMRRGRARSRRWRRTWTPFTTRLRTASRCSANDFDAFEQMDARQHRDAAAHVPLDEFAAARQHGAAEAGAGASRPPVDEPRDVARGIDERRAARHQFGRETGQQRIEAAGTARDVDVRIHRGRDAGAEFGQARQRLAIEQRHAIEMIARAHGRPESCQTAADHETVRMTRGRSRQRQDRRAVALRGLQKLHTDFCIPAPLAAFHPLVRIAASPRCSYNDAVQRTQRCAAFTAPELSQAPRASP